MDVAATAEAAALSGENDAEGRFIGSRRRLVAGCHRAGLNVLGAKNPAPRTLVRANNMGPRLGRGVEGMENCSSCYAIHPFVTSPCAPA